MGRLLGTPVWSIRISWDSSPELSSSSSEVVGVAADAEAVAELDSDGTALAVAVVSSPPSEQSPPLSPSSPSSAEEAEGEAADATEVVSLAKVEVAAGVDCEAGEDVSVLFPSPVTLASTPAACIRAMTSA